MYYLVTEDSSSGCDFWDSVAKNFGLQLISVGIGSNTEFAKQIRLFTSKQIPFSYEKKNIDINSKYEVIMGPARGKEKHSSKVTCNLSDAEAILFTYDLLGVSPASSSENAKIIKKIAEILPNAKIYYSKYGCLEAAILAFKRFKAWIHTPQEVKESVPGIVSLHAYDAFLTYFSPESHEQFVPKMGMRFHATTTDPETNVKSFSPKYVDERIINFNTYHEIIRKLKSNVKPLTTPERVCSALLEYLTKGTDFIFDKGTVGTGWTHNCQDLSDPALPKILEYQNHECQSEHLTAAQLAELGWSKSDIYDEELACRNMTARKKLLTLFEESILDSSFINARTAERCSIKDVLGISHLHAADEPNNPADACSTCRLRESPAYKDQETEQQPLLDVNQLPPPEPLPDTTPQWNQQQPNSAPAWNTYQPLQDYSDTSYFQEDQQYYTEGGNPYQQSVQAWEQPPQYLNELPAPAGNPDNIPIGAMKTSAFGSIEGYLFCTPNGTYGIWKEDKDQNDKPIMVFLIVGLTDEQPITIGPGEKKSIRELRAGTTLWEQKQIGSYGNGWQLNFPVSIAFGDKPRHH